MKLRNLLSIALCLSPLCACFADNLPVVPYPKHVQVDESSKTLPLEQGFSIAAPTEFAPAADLLLHDISRLYRLDGTKANEKALITLKNEPSLGEEGYTIKVTAEGITLCASNYRSMAMASTTLLQMIDEKSLSIPQCSIEDSPKFAFRSYLLDVARQGVEMETIKHIVELCRWYKVPYLQLHMTDDQLFTFESKIYPELKDFRHDRKWYYTREQFEELVEYATQRGVIIIPELESPGHSGAMRRLMPDLFGDKWSIIDITKPEAVAAVKKLIREMMDVFHTSPYFHISADEVWLGGFDQSEELKNHLKKHEGKLDNAHDLFLQYVVDLHEYVKSQGKTTLVWEGFGGTGSKNVQVPRDVIVDVWKMHFNRPDFLIEQGYSVINASCHPIYITPGEAYSQEYIYNWNPRRWEYPWHPNEGYTHPIQMKDDTRILGVQMCAWEMIDHEQLQVARDRIAPLSENAWNDEKKQTYAHYLPRFEEADHKILSLIFPAEEIRTGFKSPCPFGTNHHRVHQFEQKASVFFKPFDSSDKVYYTTDRSFPTPESTPMTEALTLDNNLLVRFGMYDKDGKLKAYKAVDYQLRQIDFELEGLSPLKVQKRILDHRFTFEDKATLTLINHMPDTQLHYTMDGTNPTKDSPIYTAPLCIDKDMWFKAASINDEGHIKGNNFETHFYKDSDEIK